MSSNIGVCRIINVDVVCFERRNRIDGKLLDHRLKYVNTLPPGIKEDIGHTDEVIARATKVTVKRACLSPIV